MRKTRVIVLSSDDEKEYTEEEIYNLAVKAYKSKNLSPLLNISPQTLSDKYYWCYLATNPDLFYNTMEIEMFRRRDIKQLTLVDLDKYNFTIKPSPKDRLSREDYEGLTYKGKVSSKEFIKDNTRARINLLDDMGYYFDEIAEKLELEALGMSDPNYDLDRLLQYYPDNFIEVVKDICKMGGIPAGGFVSGLINPYYYLIGIRDLDINFNWSGDDRDRIVQTEDHSYSYMDWGRKEVNGRMENIKGFGETVLVYRARHMTEEESVDSYLEYEDVLKCRKRFKDYDLERGLRKLRRHLYVKDGKIYQ
ncbi:MAG TPA: hypothetical protein PK891_04675, partial [Bacteroidales bacterium]|nr:hypothetical protein [Bacteroidales bacterium]